jgi:hypothetical protein
MDCTVGGGITGSGPAGWMGSCTLGGCQESAPRRMCRNLHPPGGVDRSGTVGGSSEILRPRRWTVALLVFYLRMLK